MMDQLHKRFIIAFVAVMAMVLILALGGAEGGTDQYVQGFTDARNGTITFNETGAFFATSTGTTGTDINFTGWINGSILIWNHNNIWQSNTTIDPATTILDFTPGQACANWIALWDNTSRILIFRSSNPGPTPSGYLSLTNFFSFYSNMYGLFAYILLLMIPVSAYLKTRSLGLMALILLFISAGGVALLPELRGIAILGVAIAIIVMLYRIFWGDRGG